MKFRKPESCLKLHQLMRFSNNTHKLERKTYSAFKRHISKMKDQCVFMNEILRDCFSQQTIIATRQPSATMRPMIAHQRWCPTVLRAPARARLQPV
jgi:hypothetical protein